MLEVHPPHKPLRGEEHTEQASALTEQLGKVRVHQECIKTREAFLEDSGGLPDSSL
jgi:hypothetical protein